MNKLFEPISIGSVALRNRIVFPPMTTGFEDKGVISKQSIDFYTTIAKGGAGLIILGDASVSPSMIPIPAIYDDSFIPGLRELAQAVQAHGAKMAPQLFHQEFDLAEIMKLPRDQGMAKIKEGMENFANTLTEAQIEEIIEKFVIAARRSQTAGFDMIQVHGDRLIGQFSSPLLNKRTDRYGGSVENRARFAIEVVKSIKKAIGNSLPIDYKLAIIRPNEGKAGPTLEEAQIFAPLLVEAGVDSFHVSIANHSGLHNSIPPMGSKPFGCFVDLAAGIKKVVTVPVTAVGRIVDPAFAEKLIKDKQADLVALGRGLIADPEWPIKVREGRFDDIRTCIMCNQGCTDRLLNRQSISCSVNTSVGKETSAQICRAETKKKIMVVGGGPAGMEACRVAALRGHAVTLIEKAESLGGQLNIASVPPHKDEMNQFTHYLTEQIGKLGVETRLRTEGTASIIEAIKPDAIIVATGAIPLVIDVPGIKDKKVTSAWDVLAGKSSVGKRAVVIGGGAVGSETAEFLAQNGREVTIVEMLDKICLDMSPTITPVFMERIAQYRIKVLTKHTLKEVTANGIVVIDENGNNIAIEADSVVLATGARANDTLEKELQERGIPVCSIGDCAQGGPRKLIDAVHEGYFAALKI